jgi:hypothetical protein
MSYSVYLASGVILSSFLYWLGSPSHSKYLLPPGPRKLPIIKNLLDFPLGEQWVSFTKWSDEYSMRFWHFPPLFSGVDPIIFRIRRYPCRGSWQVACHIELL